MNPNDNQKQPAGVTSADVGTTVLLGSVFEISENDELNDTYYTRGYFATLADAVAAVEVDGVNLCEMAQESQDFACVEIHEHRVGVLGWRGRPVWSRRWSHEWGEGGGSPRWVLMPNAESCGPAK